MLKNTLSKSDFAAKAGVTPAAVTGACKKALASALVGKRIDVDHASAVEYLEKHAHAQTPIAATGLDPLYEEAVKKCQESDRWSASFIQRELRIGYNRASKLRELFKLNGLYTDKKTTPPLPATRVVSGNEKARQTKKSVAQSRIAAAVQFGDHGIDDGDIIHEVPEDIEAFADMTLRELIHRFGTDVAFVDWLRATKEIETINEKRLKNATTKGSLISRDLVQVGVIDVFNAAHLRLLKDGAKSIAAGAISKHSSGAEISEVESFVSDILGSFIKPVKNKISRSLKDA